jgi:hypothetical protein
MTLFENIISWTLIIACLIVALHFIYENIILPGIRQDLRFRLFALRDELRNLKAVDTRVDEEAFTALDEGISRQIRNQHQITISLMKDAERLYKEDAGFRQGIDQRISILNGCQSTDFQRIRHEAARHMLDVTFMNGAIFFILMLLPLLLLLLVPVVGASCLQKGVRLLAAPKQCFDDLSNAQPAA